MIWSRGLERKSLLQILLHGIVEPNLALFVQLHDGSRRCDPQRQRRGEHATIVPLLQGDYTGVTV